MTDDYDMTIVSRGYDRWVNATKAHRHCWRNGVTSFFALIHHSDVAVSVLSMRFPWLYMNHSAWTQSLLFMMTSSNGNCFPRYWPFVRGIHQSPVNSPHKGQWRGALMFSLICGWINGKLWRGWWFETRSCPLWRHCNGNYNLITLVPDFLSI